MHCVVLVVPGHSILYNGSPSPPKIYVSEKMELVLKCRTTSSKRPNVYWLRDGHNITKTSPEIDLNFHVSYEGGSEGEIVSVLSIDVGEEEKTMNITCTSASNLQIMRSLSVLLIVYREYMLFSFNFYIVIRTRAFLHMYPIRYNCTVTSL